MKHYKIDNYNLYMVKTTNFKTISLSIYFRNRKDKEDGIYLTILKDMLNVGSKKHQKINEYYKAKLDIYNPSININLRNFGKDRMFVINSKFTNEKYTEAHMNAKTIEFIFDIIYNPNLTKENFEIAKHNYIEMLKSSKDDPFKYASDRLWEEMNVYDFKIPSIKEAIDIAKNMTLKKITSYYQKIFDNDALDIFVCGNIDYNEIKNIITNTVKGNFKIKPSNEYITFNKNTVKTKEVVEKINTAQSQLAMGLKFKNLTEFEKKYVSIFYVSILGGGWDSKLFAQVREKHSLCYYIRASRNIPYSCFFINASIDAKDFSQTLKLINKELTSMKKGNFDEKDIAKVRELYKNSLLEIKDNQLSLLNNLADQILNDNDSINVRKQKIKTVTKQDIIDISKKVSLDTIFFLRGEE